MFVSRKFNALLKKSTQFLSHLIYPCYSPIRANLDHRQTNATTFKSKSSSSSSFPPLLALDQKINQDRYLSALYLSAPISSRWHHHRFTTIDRSESESRGLFWTRVDRWIIDRLIEYPFRVEFTPLPTQRFLASGVHLIKILRREIRREERGCYVKRRGKTLAGSDDRVSITVRLCALARRW